MYENTCKLLEHVKANTNEKLCNFTILQVSMECFHVSNEQNNVFLEIVDHRIFTKSQQTIILENETMPICSLNCIMPGSLQNFDLREIQGFKLHELNSFFSFPVINH